MMISYAQNFEDVILWRVFKDITGGRYVDVGAFHPDIDSVTKWFYDQGWSGINIEPVAESFALLEAARPRDRNICAAAGALAGVAEMTVFPESRGLSSLRPPTEPNSSTAHVLTQTNVLPLRDILEPHAGQTIHFLKIDAEGTERDVLLGMDFGRFRPWVVLVEATEPLTSSRSSQEWQSILTANNYQPVYFDGLNEFFIASEHKELETQFQAPPNVFDEFEFASTVRERQWRHEMEAVLRADIAARIAEVETRNHQLATANRDISALHEERGVLRTEIATSQAAVAKLSADVAELSQALKRSQETVETIFRSRSWRWLAPIRKFNFLIRSCRKHIRMARLFR
jgi:FkbM family methyltransferase